MKLGISVGYSGADLRLPIERVLKAEALGYDSVWTAEAYGSDAITPLAYIAALTKRIRLGTGIMQLARAHAGDVRDAGGDGGRAGGRQPDDRRARRFGAADRGGLVWAAVGPPVLPVARLRHDHAEDVRAEGTGGARGQGDFAAVHGTGSDGHREAAEEHPSHEPEHPDLAGQRHGDQRAAGGGGVRRHLAAGVRSRRVRRSTGRGSRRASSVPGAESRGKTSRSRRCAR